MARSATPRSELGRVPRRDPLHRCRRRREADRLLDDGVRWGGERAPPRTRWQDRPRRGPSSDAYHDVTPYIVVEGAGRLIDFLTTVFGGEESERLPGPDGKIGHAEVRARTRTTT